MTESMLAMDIEKAIHILKAKQQSYCIQWVQNALEIEKQRKVKLTKCTSKEECRRLEKQFEKERIQDKIRLTQIQEDHQMIIKAKISQWKTHGVLVSELGTAIESQGNGMDNTTTRVDKPKKKVVSKSTLERLSAVKQGVPSPVTEETQKVAFECARIRKEDSRRLSRYAPENLKTLTETDLLQRKMNLLTQLHGVVSMQEQLQRNQEGQYTVRSAVSSWKSVT